MENKTKVLIIGAQGMLGSDLVQVLTQDGRFEVSAADLSDIDITQENQIKAYIKNIKPDYVVNCAAYTDVDKCEEEKGICNNVNGYALKYIAEGCGEIGAKLIHISTDYVFDGNKKEGNVENDSIDPVNQYGISKALGEKMVQENMSEYYIVRISWLFGKNGKNFVETMLKLAEEKDELRVVDDQHGKPTYTIDLSKALLDIIINQPEYGIYHLPNENETTWYDFAKEIFRLAEKNIKVEPCTSDEFPRPAKRPHYSILINSKLPKLRPWREALREYLDK